jgi:hypothetical protein
MSDATYVIVRQLKFQDILCCQSTFFLIETHECCRNERQALQANDTIRSLLGAYKKRAGLQLEGLRYKAGDIVITLARAMQRPSDAFKGLVVVVEYEPFANKASATGVLGHVGRLLAEVAEATVAGAKLVAIEDEDEWVKSLGARPMLAVSIMLVRLAQRK